MGCFGNLLFDVQLFFLLFFLLYWLLDLFIVPLDLSSGVSLGNRLYVDPILARFVLNCLGSGLRAFLVLILPLFFLVVLLLSSVLVLVLLSSCSASISSVSSPRVSREGLELLFLDVQQFESSDANQE